MVQSGVGKYMKLLAFYDSVEMCFRYSSRFENICSAFAIGMSLFNTIQRLFTEFSSFIQNSASFASSISIIFSWGAQKQMMRITALSIIARMANQFTQIKGAIMKFICFSMGPISFSHSSFRDFSTNESVSILINRTLPFPTFSNVVGYFNFTPNNFSPCLSFIRHDHSYTKLVQESQGNND